MSPMKNKPLRHKEQNTFKFEPFSQRITNIKIDVFHKVRHKYDEDDEETTQFYQALEKWADLNLSDPFEHLRRDLGPDLKILPQVVARKNHIVSVLQKHLEKRDHLNVQCVLELIVALANDLRQDFHPHFLPIYNQMIPLIESRNPELMEWTFHALAYLFKFLWRYLVMNLTEVFDSLIPLLSSSKPQYINSFAAQSFAFVARKVKEPAKLVKLLVRSLKKCPDGADGCGRLLFEIVKGVPGQFHSCAETILNAFLDGLVDTQMPRSLLFSLMSSCFNHLLNDVNVNHVSLLWNILLQKLEKFHSSWKLNQKDTIICNGVHLTLRLLEQAAEFKRGSMVIDITGLVNPLLKFLQPGERAQEWTETIIDILATVLMAPSLKMTQELSSEIVKTCMTRLVDGDLVDFVRKTKNYAGFEGLILPQLLKFCSTEPPQKMLDFLASLVLEKLPVAQLVEEILEWTPYSLDFSFESKNPTLYSDHCFSVLENFCSSSQITNIDDIFNALVLLPNLTPLDKDKAIQVVTQITVNVCLQLDGIQSPDSNKIEFLLSILPLSVDALLKLKPSNVSEVVSADVLLPQLLKFANCDHLAVLRTLDFYVCVNEKQSLESFFPEIRQRMFALVGSPFHKVRLLAVHILYLLEKSSGNCVMLDLLEIAYSAETTPATITDYRERLKILQKLSCSNPSVSEAVTKGVVDGKIFLRYLLGSLYLNFKLMWEPISTLVVSYSQAMTTSQFWEVFDPFLNEVVAAINAEDVHLSPPSWLQADHLVDIASKLNDLEERPDHINCRLLLLKVLENCVPICETKNKDVVTLFLNFLNNEYFKKNAEAAVSWDITRKTDEEVNAADASVDGNRSLDASVSELSVKGDVKMDESVGTVDADNTDEAEAKMDTKDEDFEIKKQLKEVEPDFEKKYRWVTKSLLAHMAVFGKLRSPKSMHKERELFKIYVDFLSHKLPDVQRAALDCVMTYRFKYLTPYKDNLYGLIDDKTFKNEVSLFRIDAESDVVKAEHRPDLIPLVLRIVYSKMYTKSSATKGSVNKQARKATVVRFLAGCNKLELESFFHMAFSLIHEWVTREDLLKTLDDITLNVDLKAVIPPRRLQSAIYLLNTILVYCGGLLGPSQLGYLLRVALVMMAHITGILQRRDEVFPGYLRAIKSIRNTCFEVLARFYKSFESYPWSLEESEAVFKVYVWPYLNKLPIEGIHSPTAQLRLFMVWSQNPRYFVLLGKHHDEMTNLSPIRVIMDLWLLEKAHASVCNAILEMVQSLMTVEDFMVTSTDDLIGDGPVQHLKVLHQAEFGQKLKELQDTDSLNYGSKLLINFVPAILERLKRKLEARRGLDRREREIMSRVTELVTDAESSEVILELLLPSLVKKAESSDDVISPLLTTVYNLIKNVDRPGRYVRKLAPLYGSVASPSARKLLFSIVITLSKLEGSENGLDDVLLEDLNAWDAKWVDQPDFARRLAAFNKLKALSDEGHVPVNLGIIVVYTCFHFIRSEKDTGLRDNARHCLEKVCTTLVRQITDDPNEKDYLLDNIILGQIRRGFTSKAADNVRNDCLSILGHLARECSSSHPVLYDLSHLGNKQDMEVDFFENLRHLQLHRRVRAMLKFSNVVMELDKPPVTRTLTQFILPIISHYLVSEKHQNKNTIVDSAIKAIGTVSHHLPWHQYQTLLLYYLNQLQTKVEFQKQIVRILVEILNAFHFNLSKADLNGLMEVKGVLAVEENDTVEESAQDVNVEAEKLTEAAVDKSGLGDEEAEGDETKMESELNIEDETEAETSTVKGSSEIVLSAGGATKVITVITQQILPKLHQVMAQKTTSETHHKLTRKMTGPEQDEEEILKVPLAVAAVKLLQKLPSKQFLDVNLPGIFMKLCTFLKSRLDSVRKITRETLQTILVSLGPDYLPTLVREMKALLTRGYQIHVLVYSIHSVLIPLEPHFQKGQLDKCAFSIIDICRMDLFGRASEEKEVNAIAGKVLEARATRSFDTFRILSKYVTERYLLDVLLPLKEELSRTMSHKYVNKVRLTLEQIVLGLTENAFLTPEALLLFAYGTSSESIPALMVDTRDQPVDLKKAEFEARRQPDAYLIPAEPKKAKVVEGANTCARTNSHLLVEFGLRLLYFLLKREKVKDKSYVPHLDPFVSLLKECLNSQHIKVGTLAAQCMTWMVKIDLPSNRTGMKEICDVLFKILHKYACAGLSKGDNFDLVLHTFNTVATIVRNVKYHSLTPEQMRTLILYCEQDIEDTSRQTTAFSLLKAIIGLKVQTPELLAVIKKVAVVSIKASEDSVRLQARQIVHNFLMHYSLGSQVDDYLAIYFAELNYEYLSGRESALEMVKNVTNAFPLEQLNNIAGVIYVNVSTVLVNDGEPSCRKTAADIISTLLSRLDNNGRNKLFDITTFWLTQKNKIIHRKLAAQLIGLFVTCEKENFEQRLKDLLPLVVEGFITGGEVQKGGVGRFVRAPQVADEQETTTRLDRNKDHFLFQLLQSIVKMATHCPAMLNEQKYAADVETIADHATNLLNHPHQWVRHSSVQLIGLVITTYKPGDVAAAANDPSLERTGFLLSDTKSRLKSLAHDVIAQLIPTDDMNEKFLMQCMKLLTYLTEIVKGIDGSEESQLSVLWIARMVQKMINYEVVNAPSSTIVRTMAFNWTAAISLKLTREELSGVAFQLLKPIARQLNVDEDDALKKSAREASGYIKKKIGADLYNETMAKLSQLIDVKRAERKKQRTQLMVTDPERAAKRKIDKNLKKKDSKKKRIKMMKMQTFKRKKRKDPLLDD